MTTIGDMPDKERLAAIRKFAAQGAYQNTPEILFLLKALDEILDAAEDCHTDCKVDEGGRPYCLWHHEDFPCSFTVLGLALRTYKKTMCQGGDQNEHTI